MTSTNTAVLQAQITYWNPTQYNNFYKNLKTTEDQSKDFIQIEKKDEVLFIIFIFIIFTFINNTLVFKNDDWSHFFTMT